MARRLTLCGLDVVLQDDAELGYEGSVTRVNFSDRSLFPKIKRLGNETKRLGGIIYMGKDEVMVLNVGWDAVVCAKNVRVSKVGKHVG